jgi:hypothetical protein
VCAVHANHELAVSNAQHNLNSRLRFIPDDLEKAADILHAAGLTPGPIFRYLCDECAERKLEVTFTVDDIRNKYAIKGGQQVLDCTNLYQRLSERQEADPTLDFDVHFGEGGRIDRIFFLMPGAKELFARLGSKVVLYDTKHGTNRYGLKCGCITTVDNNGRTRILAVSFLESEDTVSFQWVFRNFKESFGDAPNVAFTDGDTKMAAAIEKEWLGTVHLLCSWHLWKNFWKHIRNLFSKGKEKEWSKVAKMWWRLCKTSDESMQEEFDNTWDALVSFTNEHANVDGDTQKWLDGMKA